MFFLETVMMDANGAMDLSHVQSLPNRNVVFRHVDLYGASVVETIKKETGGPHAGSVVVLVGTHLCGAWSELICAARCRRDSSTFASAWTKCTVRVF